MHRTLSKVGILKEKKEYCSNSFIIIFESDYCVWCKMKKYLIHLNDTSKISICTFRGLMQRVWLLWWTELAGNFFNFTTFILFFLSVLQSWRLCIHCTGSLWWLNYSFPLQTKAKKTILKPRLLREATKKALFCGYPK